MQRYEGKDGGGGKLVAALHVANDGCGGWWSFWPRFLGTNELQTIVYLVSLNLCKMKHSIKNMLTSITIQNTKTLILRSLLTIVSTIIIIS